jgi:hypothetical protein
MSDNNDFTHEFVVYNSDNNNGTQGTGKFLLYDDNINAIKLESIDNIKIGGGSNGRILATDGEGNLRWISAAAVSGGVSSYEDLTDLPNLSIYAQTANLATVATSGSYNDLTNKPSLFSGSYADLTNKPTLVTSYNQLTDRPTIPTVPTDVSAFTNDAGYLTSVTNITGNAATVSNGVYTNGSYANPAWITSLAYSKLTDAPDLATVATTGSYDDLTNKPSLATVATTGSYSDLTNRPTIFSGSYTDLTNKPTLFDGAYLSLTGLPNLAAVATSGSYEDLSNKPSIPDLTGYATESWVQSQGYGSGSGGAGVTSYNDLTDKPSIPTSLGDLGITAGSNGQVLTLNSSLVPVWTTPTTEIPTMISSGLTAPGSAVVANATNVSVNFSDGGSGKYVFNVDELSTGASIVPQVDNAVDLGSPTNRFRHLYVAPGTIYLGDIKLTNLNGKLDAKKVINPGEEDEYEDEEDSDAFSPIRGGSGGSSALEGLDDVRLDGPSNGQVLTWNSSQEKWENQDPSGGGGSGPTNEITNTDPEGPTYSVSVGTDGVVTMVTSRGNLEFGALPEPGGPTHFHIMRPAGQEGSSDLYFGDDYNYVKLPGSYGAGTLGVEIGAKDAGDGGQSVWRFGTDGNIHLPPGGNILDSNSNSVLGGGSSASGFTKVSVLGQDDVFANEAGNELALVAGDGIAITTNDSDGTITISAASNSTPQYGYFSELVETSSSNRVNTQAVVMDSDGNSYISYVYWDDNQNKDISGMAKYDSTGEQLWAVNLASQNPDARELNIRSLEFSTVDGDPSLIAVGYYYDNNTSKDVAFMFYVNPTSGSVGEPLVDCELVAQAGMNVKDGVAGYDGSNLYAVVVGETYDQTLVKTLTPLAGSTTDKLYVSWADFNASGLNNGDQVYYNSNGTNYYVTMNGMQVSATTPGSTDPSWAGISLTISATEAGNYIITSVNGWGWLVNGWSNPVSLIIPGADLGGVTGVNDMTFDFSNIIFDNNSSNIQAAVSNIQGTPVSGVYCFNGGGFDWGAEIGNTLNFNYQLNNQAYVARFGQTASWTKNFGGGSYDRLNSVVVDDSQNVYAVGYVWNGSRGGLVIKYDIDGNQQWAVYINPENNTGNALMSVDLLSDGNVITVDEDGVITKLNSSNGDIMWQVKADDNPSWDGDFRGTATPDGDYIITNYEDNDYTQYVMRVSGNDGTSVWDKRISRTYGGDNGEVTSNDDGQYIDCNATHLTIAGRTEPPSGNSVGLVYSFPINGENTDGTYGQYVISSESMNWETLSTTSIAATVNNTDISVTVNSVSPTSGSTYVTTSTITTMGGEPVVEPTVISWTNPNDNVWRIEEYNGGASVSYNGSDYDAKWFDIANHTSGNNDFRGAIIQYHAFTNQGTIIGTIHLANDYPQQEATHTEHLSGGSDLQFVTLWDCNNERNGQLFFKMTNGNSNNLMVQWTAKIFYGSEYNY